MKAGGSVSVKALTVTISAFIEVFGLRCQQDLFDANLGSGTWPENPQNAEIYSWANDNT